MGYSIEGQRVYFSTFDETTGNIVRVVEDLHDDASPWSRSREQAFLSEKLRERFPHRWNEVPSPSPELVDISITDKCSMGCKYCYQDSKPRSKHAPKELVETMIKGFDHVPYQIAIGGGEPTQHPDFPYILRKARELGTVPNYTTAGFRMTDEIVAATNEVCGGVAMTYHAFKGFDWFKKHYLNLREKLTVKLNIHLIADKDVATNLKTLVAARDELGPLSIVLLAYYPDVGRANLSGLMTRTTYMKRLPDAIVTARNCGVDIAFSEGLLPYFLSRPELGVNTRFALRGEGVFSCYVDPKGRMSMSSFNPPRSGDATVFETGSQKLWSELRTWSNTPSGEACLENCRNTRRCATPDQTHYLICAFAPHNKLPLPEEPVERRTRFEILQDE